MRQDRKYSADTGNKPRTHSTKGDGVEGFVREMAHGKSLPKGVAHIREVMDNLVGTSALPVDFGDAEIWKVWDAAVGAEIAHHARPSSIKKRGIASQGH